MIINSIIAGGGLATEEYVPECANFLIAAATGAIQSSGNRCMTQPITGAVKVTLLDTANYWIAAYVYSNTNVNGTGMGKYEGHWDGSTFTSKIQGDETLYFTGPIQFAGNLGTINGNRSYVRIVLRHQDNSNINTSEFADVVKLEVLKYD